MDIKAADRGKEDRNPIGRRDLLRGEAPLARSTISYDSVLRLVYSFSQFSDVSCITFGQLIPNIFQDR